MKRILRSEMGFGVPHLISRLWGRQRFRFRQGLAGDACLFDGRSMGHRAHLGQVFFRAFRFGTNGHPQSLHANSQAMSPLVAGRQVSVRS